MSKKTAVKTWFTEDELKALPVAKTQGNRVRAALAEWRQMKNEMHRQHGLPIIEPTFDPLVKGNKDSAAMSKVRMAGVKKQRREKKKKEKETV